MRNKNKIKPIILYNMLAIALMILFFMFYSFSVDSDAVVLGYISNMVTINRADIITNLADQVNNIKKADETKNNISASSQDIAGFIKTAEECLTFLYENKYTYGRYAMDRPVDKMVTKQTNCGDYVTWVLNTHYGDSVIPYGPAAKVVTALIKEGWEINEDINNIQTGDVIFMTQQQTPNKNMISQVKAGALGSGYHVEICVDADKQLYCGAGSANGWNKNNGKAFYKDVSRRFICSVHYKGRE